MNSTFISFYIINSRHWCIIEHDFKFHRKLHISFLTFFSLGSPGRTLSETLQAMTRRLLQACGVQSSDGPQHGMGRKKLGHVSLHHFFCDANPPRSAASQAKRLVAGFDAGMLTCGFCFTIFHEVRHILMDSPAPCSRVAHAKRPNASGAQEHLTIQVPEEQLFRTAQPPADELQRDPHQQ